MVFVGQQIVGIVRESSLNERRSLFFMPCFKGQTAQLRFRVGVSRTKLKDFGERRSGVFGLPHLFVDPSKRQTRTYTSLIKLETLLVSFDRVVLLTLSGKKIGQSLSQGRIIRTGSSGNC